MLFDKTPAELLLLGLRLGGGRLRFALFGNLPDLKTNLLAFALLPLIQTAVPIRDLDALVSASTLAPLFNSERLILDVMSGKFLI